ncbi:hypothetical protein LBWT_X3370 (plasmid) [Leptolyngbya boryana IAM M-101]|nr:hypothetical protein LBWT_X3370 [Leptolyngbya boryana IAM M-101]BAS66613.1 hypothetical protein LBDG_X3370 [Leptolyngbya boryana dg5]
MIVLENVESALKYRTTACLGSLLIPMGRCVLAKQIRFDPRAITTVTIQFTAQAAGNASFISNEKVIVANFLKAIRTNLLEDVEKRPRNHSAQRSE